MEQGSIASTKIQSLRMLSWRIGSRGRCLAHTQTSLVRTFRRDECSVDHKNNKEKKKKGKSLNFSLAPSFRTFQRTVGAEFVERGDSEFVGRALGPWWCFFKSPGVFRDAHLCF